MHVKINKVLAALPADHVGLTTLASPAAQAQAARLASRAKVSAELVAAVLTGGELNAGHGAAFTFAREQLVQLRDYLQQGAAKPRTPAAHRERLETHCARIGVALAARDGASAATRLTRAAAAASPAPATPEARRAPRSLVGAARAREVAAGVALLRKAETSLRDATLSLNAFTKKPESVDTKRMFGEAAEESRKAKLSAQLAAHIFAPVSDAIEAKVVRSAQVSSLLGRADMIGKLAVTELARGGEDEES